MSKIVLHVDDSATMQMVADITFRGTDYQCVSARSVDEALEKAKAQRPTLVLADAQMPGKTGYDLCLAIKSDPKLADVPVVILCGNAQAFDAAKGSAVGADGTLPKPWDSQVMLEKVGEAVEKASKGVAKPGGAAPPSGAPAAVAAVAPTPAVPTPVAAVAAAAANTKGVPQPPRSATIMGMPTIKMPPGNAAAVPVTSATPPAAVAPAAPPTPLRAPGPAAPLRAPAAAAAATSAATSAASGAGAPVAVGPATPAAAISTPPVLSSVPASAGASPARPPMVASTPTKRSALVERTLAKMAARLAEASGLEPGSPELLALLKLSTEVVERVVWEVVPELAEQIIRENLEQLAAARRN